MTSILDPTATNLGDEENPFEDGPGYCPTCGAKDFACRQKAMLGSGGGVTIVRRVRTHEGEARPMHTLKAKTWVNRDSTKVAKEGSTEAAFLLGLEGDEISDETAKRLGLVDSDEAKGKYDGMKVAELEAEIAGRDDVDEPASGKKADLIAALEAADAKGNETSTEGGTTDQGEGESTDGTKQAEKPAEA